MNAGVAPKEKFIVGKNRSTTFGTSPRQQQIVSIVSQIDFATSRRYSQPRLICHSHTHFSQDDPNEESAAARIGCSCEFRKSTEQRAREDDGRKANFRAPKARTRTDADDDYQHRCTEQGVSLNRRAALTLLVDPPTTYFDVWQSDRCKV